MGVIKNIEIENCHFIERDFWFIFHLIYCGNRALSCVTLLHSLLLLIKQFSSIHFCCCCCYKPSVPDCMHAQWNVYYVLLYIEYLCDTNMGNKSNALCYCLNLKTLQTVFASLNRAQCFSISFIVFRFFLCVTFHFSYWKKTTIFKRWTKLNNVLREFHMALSCHQPFNRMHFLHTFCLEEKKNGEVWALRTSNETTMKQQKG